MWSYVNQRLVGVIVLFVSFDMFRFFFFRGWSRFFVLVFECFVFSFGGYKEEKEE